VRDRKRLDLTSAVERRQKPRIAGRRDVRVQASTLQHVSRLQTEALANGGTGQFECTVPTTQNQDCSLIKTSDQAEL
jgi:hypothetical protein